jgi:PKD repeat protein
MRTILFTLISSLLIGIFIISACRKAENVFNGDIGLGNPFTKSTMSNFSQYVSYDASHNVLVFNRFEDVENLFDALDEYESTYPIDRGNTDLIFDQFRLIRQNGFTVGAGVQPSTNVSLPQLEATLLSSYPLSDSVLNGLVDLYDDLQPASFPPPFMRTVLEANASFSYDVRESIVQSSLPPGIKTQILEKDDNTTMVPNHAYDDFLNSFSGYQSLYKTLELVEKNQLESGMDPANPLFDNDFVSDEQLRLILNTQREVYIKNSLIKLYDSCRYAIFQGSITEAYAQLAMVDNNGFKPIPSGIAETPAGLTITEMNTYFPMNYALAHPDNIELKEERGGKEINMAAFEAPIEFCPQSNILFTKPIADGLTVNYTAHVSNSADIGTVYRYWTFGDGTGSFQANPTHTYMQPGVYQVTLTTFNDQCGCWDVQSKILGVGFGTKDCWASLGVINVATNDGSITASVIGQEDNLEQITNVIWDFGDGSTPQNTLDLNVTHDYVYNDDYVLKVTLVFGNNTCVAIDSVKVTIVNGEKPCCDFRDKYKEREVFVIDGANYRLKVKDIVKGNPFIGRPRIQAYQKFYSKGNVFWSQRRANHSVSISGRIHLKENRKCGLEAIIAPYFNNPTGKSENNQFSCSLTWKMASGNLTFGMKEQDQVEIKHFIRLPNVGNDSLILYFGDCR